MEGHDIQTSEEEVVYVSRKAKPPQKKIIIRQSIEVKDSKLRR